MPDPHMPVADVPANLGSGPYPSFSDLRTAHLDLRKRCAPQRTGRGGLSVDSNVATRPDAGAIRALIARVRATGAILGDPDERRAAQGFLDYWGTELVSLPKAVTADFMPPLLAPYDVSARPVSETVAASSATREASTAAPASVDIESTTISEAVKRAEGLPETRSRELVRLAAAARLWRDSGRQDGYLLWGEQEIEAASRYAAFDPDIAALVEASRKSSAGYLKLKYGLLSGATAMLVVMLLVAFWKWWEASVALERLSAETDALTTTSAELKQAVAGESTARNTVRTNAESADQVQHRLDLAIATLRKLYVGGRLPEPEIPKELATAVTSRVTPNPQEPPAATDTPPPAGYDAQFLGAPLPLPGTAAPRLRADFIHFSVALDPQRRLGVAAASNLDRDKRLVLRRRSLGLEPDPRLPVGAQPDPAWFRSPQIDIGHLVSRREISWGDDPAVADSLVGIANALPNVAPQFDTFNEGIWADLENWVLTKHNQAAARVSVFTGPVLTASDPVVEGVSMPRSFWKIAVSRNQAGGTGLVVDAFLISQFQGGSNEKAERDFFDPARFRVTIAEIERLTGLDFGASLRQAATSEAPDKAPPAQGRPDLTVSFRFAGMKREDATALSGKLKALGWKIPGEERTGAAANQMEVRYGSDADEKAAEQLADDLRKLGLSRIVAKQVSVIKDGTLEVWVSR